MNNKLLYALLTASAPLLTGCSEAEKPIQPNILWVITDDHRADALACWNRATTGKSESALGYVYSPNLDRLASEGVLFTNTFCNCPLSGPSRASMHTGRYPHHSGIYDFVLSHSENDNAKPTMPAVLREAGYKATLFGKLGVRIFEYREPMDFIDNPNIYNERVAMESDLERSGVSDWCKKGVTADGQKLAGELETWYYPDGSEVSYYLVKRDGTELTEEDYATQKRVAEEQDIIRLPSMPHDGDIIAGVNTMPTGKTLDAYIAKEFMSYLDHQDESYNILNGREIEGPKSGQPQFINLGFHFPHSAVMPTQEYRDMFSDKRYNIPAFDEEEKMGLPSSQAGWFKRGNITSLSDEKREQVIRDYYAFSAMGDKLLGEAVDKFKAYCDERNEPYIIVIACGDHGWHLGEQGVACKGSNFLKSNQTAVIAISSDKSIFPAGKVVNDLVEYVDFAPTFLEAAGVDIDSERFDYLDGRPLTATTSGSIEPRDYVLGGISSRSYLRSDDFAFSMDTRNTKISSGFTEEQIRWAFTAPEEDVHMSLFDRRVDPDERNNVAYDEEYKELAAWLRNKLCTIVLGDNRQECDWTKINSYTVSNFAPGSDDKRLDIPENIIPKTTN